MNNSKNVSLFDDEENAGLTLAEQKESDSDELVNEQGAYEPEMAALAEFQPDDPLHFDMAQVLTFKMPKIKSIKMYNKIDSGNPGIKFRDSKYYQTKQQLGGFMKQDEL